MKRIEWKKSIEVTHQLYIDGVRAEADVITKDGEIEVAECRINGEWVTVEVGKDLQSAKCKVARCYLHPDEVVFR